MVTKKPSLLLKKIEPEIDRISKEFHRNSVERGFLHWAISEILVDEDLSDEVLVLQRRLQGGTPGPSQRRAARRFS